MATKISELTTSTTATGAEQVPIVQSSTTKKTTLASIITDLLTITGGAVKVGADDGSSGSIWTTVQGFINKIISSVGSAYVGFIQSGTGAVATTVQAELLMSVSVRQFGAVSDLATDDTSAVQKAMNSITVNAHAAYLRLGGNVIDTVVVPANKTFYLLLHGSLKHKAAATGPMFQLSSGSSVIIIGNENEIDGNRANQTIRPSIFDITACSVFEANRVRFRDVSKSAILGRQDDYKSLYLKSCSFVDADLHTGVLGGTTCFIDVHGGDQTIVDDCIFSQTADPAVNQCRQPGGIIVSGGNADKKVIIKNSNFTNLGQNAAGNIISPIDIYSHASYVLVEGNTFLKSRFASIRTTNCNIAEVSNNYVYQDVPMITDGGAAYPDPACLVQGIVGRGYAINDVDNYLFKTNNNHFYINGVDCSGIVVSNDSTTRIINRFESDNNYLYSSGANAYFGIFLNKVKNSNIIATTIDGFAGQGVRFQQTSIDALAASVASLAIRDSKISVANVGVLATLSVTNANILLDNVDLSANTGSFAFQIRNAADVSVSHCNMPSTNNGDAYTNAAFLYYNNYVTHVSDPAGFTTNTYYRLKDNTGRNDLADNDKTITPAGTTGAQTINKLSGSVNFAAAAASLVVTNSLVSAASVVTATVATNDATMKSVTAVVAGGSFTLYANAAPTNETKVVFRVQP